jgi:hypothetical protein
MFKHEECENDVPTKVTQYAPRMTCERNDPGLEALLTSKIAGISGFESALLKEMIDLKNRVSNLEVENKELKSYVIRPSNGIS